MKYDINPNKTPSGISLDEIRAITRRDSDHIRYVEIRSKKHLIPIIALPTVYLSDEFGDTRYFAEIITDYVTHRFLEIGSGTGVLTIAAALESKEFLVSTSTRYWAVDSNPQAVLNTKLNAVLNEVENLIEVREGDVFQALEIGEKFDCIFWNHPFHRGAQYEDIVQRACFDPMFKGFEQYVQCGHDYLNPGGRLLLGSGNFADLDEMSGILDKHGCQMNLLCYSHKPCKVASGYLGTVNLYEITKTKPKL